MYAGKMRPPMLGGGGRGAAGVLQACRRHAGVQRVRQGAAGCGKAPQGCARAGCGRASAGLRQAAAGCGRAAAGLRQGLRRRSWQGSPRACPASRMKLGTSIGASILSLPPWLHADGRPSVLLSGTRGLVPNATLLGEHERASTALHSATCLDPRGQDRRNALPPCVRNNQIHM